MYLLIILVIMTPLALVIQRRLGDRNIPSTIMLWVALSLTIMVLIDIGISLWAPNHGIFIERTAIVTIKDQSKLTGSFGLFGGSINEEPVYYYYAASDKGYELRSIPADRTIIVEDNGAPHIDIYGPELDSSYTRWQVFHLNKGHPENGYRYYVYVPQGAIVREFVLDAEM